MTDLTYTLTFSCPDQPGVQNKITSLLLSFHANLDDVASYTDHDAGMFYSRIAMTLDLPQQKKSHFFEQLNAIGTELNLTWNLTPSQQKTRALILVSREGHCLNDLLYRSHYNDFPLNIVAVASNHTRFEKLTNSHDVPFHHLPINSPEEKPHQEQQLKSLVDDHQIELIILARYMQILSDDLTRTWSGKCINIHHSFLPSFKGANPYRQAHQRGVKMIGATAHYVTADLDEGPIIEQDIEHITHKDSPETMKNKGRGIEVRVLRRAVQWHAEKRVFISGNKTITFQ